MTIEEDRERLLEIGKKEAGVAEALAVYEALIPVAAIRAGVATGTQPRPENAVSTNAAPKQ